AVRPRSPSGDGWVEEESAMSLQPLPARRSALRIVVPPRRRPDKTASSSSHEPKAPGSLTSGAAWLLSANMLYAAVQWGTLVALAKLGTPVTLGYFGLALAIATPSTMLAGFGLRAMQATDVQRRYAFADYLHLRLLGNLLALAIVAGVVACTTIEPAAVAVPV